MARRAEPPSLTHLRVTFSDTFYVGPGRADLLEGIAATGSIAAAGKRMAMSYKRAWSLVQALNEGFGRPLVTTSRGGSEQGGAALTEDGQFVLDRYRAMQEATRTAIAGDVAAVAKRLDIAGRKSRLPATPGFARNRYSVPNTSEPPMRLLRRSVLGLAVAFSAAMIFAPAHGGTVNAAVAANFTRVAEQLGADFMATTGHDVVFSFGATGALYTQITQAAPFDVFFAADDKRTRTAIEEGFGVDGTEFTYAMGKVVLYSPTLDLTDGEAVLRAGGFHHIAIADPKTAPYGVAGMAVLEALGLTEAVTPKIVTGENITQTQQFIDSGSAELGFVALSQVIGKPAAQVWLPPQEDYPAIRQNAVLLTVGETNDAARAFLDYVKSDAAIAVIKAAGYELE
jgi:molybdate transport system substrate-binding protein